MKCARTACLAEADPRLRHRDTGRAYCPRCARSINELNKTDLIPWADVVGKKKPGT